MTAAAVLALCVSRGLQLAPIGEGVRIHGPKPVRDELREAIRACKTELASLLRAGREAEVRALYSQAFARLGAPDSMIGNLWPAIAREQPARAQAIDVAEQAADAAALSYQSGEAPDSGQFLAALATWERAWAEAIAAVTSNVCSDCGARAVVLVTTDYGSKFCRRCLRPAPLNCPPKVKGARRDA